MRCLILVDAQFALHERALIERLVIGLANEGVAAQVVLPKGHGLEEVGFNLITEPVWYADRGLAFTRSIRANQVVRQLEKDSSFSDVDVIHVLGGSAWSLGRELASILDAGLIYEIWRSSMSNALKSLHLDHDERVLFSVPERSFRIDCADAGYADRVRVSPWGAHIETKPIDRFHKDSTTGVVLLSSGRVPELSVAAFEGVLDIIENDDRVMLFANSEVVSRANLWKRVKARNFQDRFTIIDRCEDRRDLLMRCDVFIYPDMHHEERTMLLDAMGAGMLVIAGNDEQISAIQENDGVRIVEKPSRDCWAQELGAVMKNPKESRELGDASRAYVMKNRKLASMIESVVESYALVMKQHTSESIS